MYFVMGLMEKWLVHYDILRETIEISVKVSIVFGMEYRS